MKYSFTVSRKVRIPLQDNYNAVEYFHSSTVEYNEDETEHSTILSDQEFRMLAEEVDEAQRQMIKKEIGITLLPHDDFKLKLERKNKLKKRNTYLIDR